MQNRSLKTMKILQVSRSDRVLHNKIIIYYTLNIYSSSLPSSVISTTQDVWGHLSRRVQIVGLDLKEL